MTNTDGELDIEIETEKEIEIEIEIEKEKEKENTHNTSNIKYHTYIHTQHTGTHSLIHIP